MATYLIKSEPSEYAYADLEREGRTVWSGVTNNAALMHLRAMRKGDEAIFYHSGPQKRIAGLASVVADPSEDPDRPGTNAKGEPKFAVVEIKPAGPASGTATLADIKADARFAEFALVKQPRLSVMPVPPDIAAALKALAGLA